MVRIAGVDLLCEKRVEVGLMYVVPSQQSA